VKRVIVEEVKEVEKVRRFGSVFHLFRFECCDHRSVSAASPVRLGKTCRASVDLPPTSILTFPNRGGRVVATLARAWESIKTRLIPHALASVATRKSRYDKALAASNQKLAGTRDFHGTFGRPLTGSDKSRGEVFDRSGIASYRD